MEAAFSCTSTDQTDVDVHARISTGLPRFPFKIHTRGTDSRAVQRDGGWRRKTGSSAASEHLALLDYKLDRREELERKVEALIVEPAYREAVGCLCGLKVISTQAAMVPVTKIGDFRRFEHPCKLMAYVGLVPSGHSRGGTRRQSSVTKPGGSASSVLGWDSTGVGRGHWRSDRC